MVGFRDDVGMNIVHRRRNESGIGGARIAREARRIFNKLINYSYTGCPTKHEHFGVSIS